MKPILIAGITIVNLALAMYTTAIILQNRRKEINRKVLTFLTLGVVFDVSATIFMIIGSGNFLTLHGIIGYTSLSGMLADTLFSYRLKRRSSSPTPVSPKFNRWSLMAYSYWVVAYITGAILVMLR